jgi:predicted alpha/beta superfamily hydrolase
MLGFGGAAALAQSRPIDRFTLQSEDGKTHYVVDVWLPRGYGADVRPYPMLLMLDGEYAFNSAVQISDYLQRDGETDAFMVVGVSYGVGFGAPLAAERTRDFTPPVDAQGLIARTETAYYRFIKNTLLPQLRNRYRIDPDNRALWGYSLSGSFAAWLNFHDPSLFDHYILASGNLMQFGIVQNLFQGRLFSGVEYSGRKVMISYDVSEIPDPKILEDGQKLLAREGAFPGHTLRLFLTQGETHASSWFVALPTSLRYVFGRGPATSADHRKAIASAPAPPEA